MKFQEKLNSETVQRWKGLHEEELCRLSAKGGLWRSWGPGTRASPRTCRCRVWTRSWGVGGALGVSQALELGAGRGHTSGQAQAAEAMAPVPCPKAAGLQPSGHVGTLDPPTTDQAWETGNHGLRARKAPSGRSLPPASHGGLGPLCPAPMGLTLSRSLSAPSCFPSEAENGSLVTNMASGHWVMRSSSRGRSTKGPFVRLPAPLPGSSRPPAPPTHPTPSWPRLPPRAAPPGPPGVTVAWPWRPPSPGALLAGAGPAGCGGHIVGGHAASGRPPGAGCGVAGVRCNVLWCTPGLQRGGPSALHPRPPSVLRQIAFPSTISLHQHSSLRQGVTAHLSEMEAEAPQVSVPTRCSAGPGYVPHFPKPP